VTCHGDEPGKLDTKSFTASGLSKITLPNGCSAETDTHIFAAADDGFDRAETDYIVAYVWPFDPLTLTPGLDTKKFSEILKRSLTKLANNTRHNIPLEVALQAVGAEYGVPMELNQILDNHHYVTVLITVVVLIVGGFILVVIAVLIWRGTKERRETSLMINYMHKRQNIFGDTLQFLEDREALKNPDKPRKGKAPQPQWDMVFPDPTPYAGQCRGRPPVAVEPGCALGLNAALILEMEEINATTTGPSLGMNETELIGTGARRRGAFDLGGDQEASRNYPRAPTTIDMNDMMQRK
jgi:hypothetical protein